MAATSNPASSPARKVSGRLGRYELLHEIASGGMATVYLGRVRGHGGFERLVAVKCCHPHLRSEEEFVAMFLDEARLAARIHHPNVVATLDASGSEVDTLYLVMEFIDGYSLWQVLRAAGKQRVKLAPKFVARVMVDALYGLHAAHELRSNDDKPLNIVHRDVSPHNLLIGIDGVARIMDFGIAKAESRLSVTREGRLKGKLGYMAPEQHGIGLPPVKAEVTRQADVYAAGVVLWESLTGRKLFHGENDGDTVKRLVRAVVPPLAELAPDAPREIDAIVARALAREPANRYATALEFAEAIEASGIPLASRREVSETVRELLSPQVKARAELLRSVAEADRVHRPESIAPETDAPSHSTTITAGSIGMEAPPVAVDSLPPPAPRTGIARWFGAAAVVAGAVLLAIFAATPGMNRARAPRGFITQAMHLANSMPRTREPLAPTAPSISSAPEMHLVPVPIAPVIRTVTEHDTRQPTPRSRAVTPRRREYRPATL